MTTRAEAEAELIDRAGNTMELVGFTVTATGSNTDLQSPLAYALRQMGLAAGTPVTDANIAAVPTADLDKFYDLAELRLLKNCKRNYTAVDFSLGPRRESYNQIRAGLEADITALEAQIKAQYGIGGATLTYGIIRNEFAEHEDSE